jgi:hypothetical protein
VAGRRPFRGGANGSEVDRTLGVLPSPLLLVLSLRIRRCVGPSFLCRPNSRAETDFRRRKSMKPADERQGCGTSRARIAGATTGRRSTEGSGTSRVCDPISWPARFQCAEGKQSARVVATMKRHRAHGRSESPRRRHARHTRSSQEGCPRSLWVENIVRQCKLNRFMNIDRVFLTLL